MSADAASVRVKMLTAVIKVELRRAGARPEKVAELARLVDLDGLDVDDDGVLTGLGEQVAEIRKDYSSGFLAAETKPAERKKPASRAAEEDRRTATERQAAAMLGGGGGVGGGGAVGQAVYLLRASGRAEEAAQLLRRHGRGGPPEAA